MKKSEESYRQCLFHHNIAEALAHPQVVDEFPHPAGCDELKKDYERDKAAYEGR